MILSARPPVEGLGVGDVVEGAVSWLGYKIQAPSSSLFSRELLGHCSRSMLMVELFSDRF